MDHTVEYIEFRMVRDDLHDLPDVSLLAGYHIRRFQPGDERHWAEIEVRAEDMSSVAAGLDYFATEFGPFPDDLRERMFFLVTAGGEPIGTATAWYGELSGRPMGKIHWVAIVPEFQGRGLSKPLLGAAMQILAQNHDSAFLETQTSSWRGVGLYRTFGFRPVLDSPESERAWGIATEKLAAASR